MFMKYELKGLYVITDSKLIPEDSFFETVELAVKGGANILQLRDKGSSDDEIFEKGKGLLKITQKYGIPLIINDSPELARRIGADGVHLGEGDPVIEHARQILGRSSIIGVSCYGDIGRGVEAVKKGASYLAFGTPYSTPTKPGRKPTPFETLEEAKKKINTVPIFSIGGIYPHNAGEVLATGVDGIAAITSVFKEGNVEENARNLALYFD